VSTSIDREPLDAFVAGFAAERHCPSVAWGIVSDGVLVVHGATGTVHGETPTERTVYRIASITKSFSAAVTLLLRDEGALRLDDPIGVHAPELASLRSPTVDAPPITVRDLLCMSSGLVSDDPWADRHLDLTDDELDALVADGLVFARPTGSSFEYSNLGYALLGRIVHRATGTRLRDHVTARLLRPLGMEDTTWDQPDHARWAPPTRWLDDRWVVESAPLPDGVIAPMGGLWTNVADLATWVAWLADSFPARNGADLGPLARSSRRELQTPQRYAGQRTVRGIRVPTAYGFGTVILDEPEHGTVVGHSGGLPGYGANMRWTPGGAIGVIALSNVTYAPMTELAAHLHDLVVGQGVVPPADRRPAPAVAELAGALLGVLEAWATGESVDPHDLARVFADNIEPDDTFELRASRAAALGPLTMVGLRSTSDAAAEMTCTATEGGTATVTFTLAPHLPPRIQSFEVKPNDAP
jgi:serine-type D-Ala-D-Ala carboxypeptidase/endopeptidase